MEGGEGPDFKATQDGCVGPLQFRLQHFPVLSASASQMLNPLPGSVSSRQIKGKMLILSDIPKEEYREQLYKPRHCSFILTVKISFSRNFFYGILDLK